MLYTTTRNNRETFLHSQVLLQNRDAGGGLFVPLRTPCFTPGQLRAMGEKSFGQCVADVLNLLFQTSLTAWDVDFSIGRYPVRMVSLRNRMVMAECWHNPDWDFQRTVSNLAGLMEARADLPGNWFSIAVRVAVLFGIFSELRKKGFDQADVSVVSGDYTAPISAWYARAMGLPIGNIVCCCNENQNLWDLHLDGQMRTDTVAVSSPVPEADITRPVNLERMIYVCGGTAEAVRYWDALSSGSVYEAGEATLENLRKGQFVSVVSSSRLLKIISGAYATHQYIHSPGAALAYAGALDYRAKTGQTRPAVILAEKSPALDLDFVAGALGMTGPELDAHI